MTKFVKTLIILNGLLIPIILLIFLIVLLKDTILGPSYGYKPEAISTENIITKNGDTLITQGVRYLDPESVYNSSNFIIKVMPKTYDEPKKIESKSLEYTANISFRNIPGESSGYFVNILFLDANYKVIRRLVDKRASIESLTIPSSYNREEVDTTVKNIGYLIAFEDSNNDKMIDWNDNYDLYISNLDGKNLYQITKGIDVSEFKFINQNKDIFISFTDRTDIREEYKIKKFAIFNIKTRQLRQLDEVEKALIEIQKILR
jgi:hypothetical protein